MSQHPESLHRAIEAAKRLRLEIALMLRGEEAERDLTPEEAQTLADTFEGETTLDAELAHALKGEDDDKILIDGISARMTELAARRDRLKKRVETRRGLMEQALILAGWERKLETPLGTLSLAKSPDKVMIDDEAAVPSVFWKPQDPVLDKSAVGAVLKDYHKKLNAALALKDDAQRAEALEALLPVALGLRQPTDVLPPGGTIAQTKALNDPAARADGFLAILQRLTPVPGAHLEIGGQHLVVRRR